MKLTNENYVSEAEKVMKDICENAGREGVVSTSKIRKILAMVSDIYNDARHISGNTLDSEMKGRIQYLKLHIVYEAGRENAVKTFVTKAQILKELDSIGDQKDRLIVFCHYMEALVAYRKFIGGKDE